MLVRLYVVALAVLGGCSFPKPSLIEEQGNGDFAVTLDKVRARVVEGASTTVGVTLVRSGLIGPVTVAVTGLPAGVAADPLTIEANAGTLTLHAASDAPQGDSTLTITAFAAELSHDTALPLLTMGPPGTLDRTFGAGGMIAVLPVGRAEALAIQPDGKIIIAGPAGIAGSQTYSVIRYQPDGAIDTSFSTGTVLLDAYLAGATAMALQPDGKIVIAETFGHRSTEGIVVRLNGTDGSLDTSFGEGGKVVLDLTDPDAGSARSTVLSAIATRPDGSIVVAGNANIVANGIATSSGVIAQLTPRGALDANFGTSGRSLLVVTSSRILDLLIDPEGFLLISGIFDNGTAEDPNKMMIFSRQSPQGITDRRFNGGGGGAIVLASDSLSGSMIFHPNGKIYSGTGSATGQAYLVSFDSILGYLDIDFGNRGIKATGLPIGSLIPSRLVQTQNGQLAIAGTASIDNTLAAYVARFDPDGQLDNTFGGGMSTVTFPAGNTYFRAAAVDNEGRIVAAGFRDGPPDKVLLCRFWP